MASTLFYLFMFTALAALGYAGFQVFKTNQSPERHGDDKNAPTHRLEREQAEVEADRVRLDDAGDRSRDALGDETRAPHRQLAEKHAGSEVERERHADAVHPG